MTDDSPPLTYTTLPIEKIWRKYDDGNVSWRRISDILYRIQGSVHDLRTKKVTELHRLTSRIRSNLRSMCADDNRLPTEVPDDNRLATCGEGTRLRSSAKLSRFKKQERCHQTLYIEEVLYGNTSFFECHVLNANDEKNSILVISNWWGAYPLMKNNSYSV